MLTGQRLHKRCEWPLGSMEHAATSPPTGPVNLRGNIVEAMPLGLQLKVNDHVDKPCGSNAHGRGSGR